jgi:alkyl hydroperoxide reductase subunit AhpC
MACATCGASRKGNGYIEPSALEFPPYKASDIFVLDNKQVRKLSKEDWSKDRHKLLLFFPEVFTPVCSSEMGALKEWIEPFNELGVDVFAATADPIHAVKDWYEQEEAIRDPNYKIISSYLLTTRLGVLLNGRAKRASVFITSDGDVVVQEHFLKVGRSLAELHRMMYGYTQDSYCAEGWTSPADGFLNG